MKIQKKLAFIMMLAMLFTLFSTPVWAQEMNSTTTVPVMATTTEDQTATTATDTETTAGETAGTTAPTRVEGGVYRTSMIILERGGQIAARVTDEKGNPVEGILVGLQLGTTQMLDKEPTDKNGYATFRYTFPGQGTYIYCYSEQTEIDGIIYKAAGAAIGKQPAGATTATLEAETGGTTRNPANTNAHTTKKKTTKKSTATTKPLTVFTAPGTTGMQDAFVMLDFCFDSGILDAFGIKQQDFADKARLLLEQDSYNTIMQDYNGILMMSAATSKYEVTDEQLEAALAEDKVLSRIKPSGITRIVMDLSMKYRESTSGELIPVWNAAEGAYVFQFPVPDSMRSAQTVAVAAVTADGISEPAIATVSKDGILRFETTSPVGTIVLLGFKSGLLGTLTSHGAGSSLLFLAAGIVCIGIALFLFFRFVYQPKKAKKKEGEPQEVTETDTYILPDDQPQEEPLGGLDIFAESDPIAPPKNPTDYDIEL